MDYSQEGDGFEFDTRSDSAMEYDGVSLPMGMILNEFEGLQSDIKLSPCGEHGGTSL